MENWERLVVRKSICVECGAEFNLSLQEFIQKLDNGMRLPKRCKGCRSNRRRHPDPYAGFYSVYVSYPLTKGHRGTVHGG